MQKSKQTVYLKIYIKKPFLFSLKCLFKATNNKKLFAFPFYNFTFNKINKGYAYKQRQHPVKCPSYVFVQKFPYGRF